MSESELLSIRGTNGAMIPAEEVFCPTSESEAVEVVKRLSESGKSAVVVGAGLALETGNPLKSDRWTAVSTDGLAGIREYSPADMVITVGAGTTLQELANVLAAEKQCLPIDAPFLDRATVGGMIACNAAGSLRGSFGAPRDRLLGGRVVLSSGEVAKFGGKVVKNVAGYDMGKLVAGSWGSLGLITEVTLKTHPLPPVQGYLQGSAATVDAAFKIAAEVRRMKLDPTALVVRDAPQPRLMVTSWGRAELVDWQLAKIGEIISSNGGKSTRVDSIDPWRGPAGSIQVRFSIHQTAMERLILDLSANGFTWNALPHLGVVEAAADGTITSDHWGLLDHHNLGRLIRTVPERSSLVTDVFGLKPELIGLMKGVKNAWDPHHLFSPGRFAGGI